MPPFESIPFHVKMWNVNFLTLINQFNTASSDTKFHCISNCYVFSPEKDNFQAKVKWKTSEDTPITTTMKVKKVGDRSTPHWCPSLKKQEYLYLSKYHYPEFRGSMSKNRHIVHFHIICREWVSGRTDWLEMSWTWLWATTRNLKTICWNISWLNVELIMHHALFMREISVRNFELYSYRKSRPHTLVLFRSSVTSLFV